MSGRVRSISVLAAAGLKVVTTVVDTHAQQTLTGCAMLARTTSLDSDRQRQTATIRMLHAIRYGRHYDDFVPGAIYQHPWEVTVDEGMLALFAASFQDAIPTYASRRVATNLGFSDRPIHPLVLLNLGLSFSVHDVSEQAIAHLAYLVVRFPNACFPGDSVSASSCVIGMRPVSTGEKGVVHVRTELRNQNGVVVCSFERKALVRAGHLAERPPQEHPTVVDINEVRQDEPPRAPSNFARKSTSTPRTRCVFHLLGRLHRGRCLRARSRPNSERSRAHAARNSLSQFSPVTF